MRLYRLECLTFDFSAHPAQDAVVADIEQSLDLSGCDTFCVHGKCLLFGLGINQAQVLFTKGATAALALPALAFVTAQSYLAGLKALAARAIHGNEKQKACNVAQNYSAHLISNPLIWSKIQQTIRSTSACFANLIAIANSAPTARPVPRARATVSLFSGLALRGLSWGTGSLMDDCSLLFGGARYCVLSGSTFSGRAGRTTDAA